MALKKGDKGFVRGPLGQVAAEIVRIDDGIIVWAKISGRIDQAAPGLKKLVVNDVVPCHISCFIPLKQDLR
ncbi:MAG: hypothetical protein QNJ62_04935 [Methyloceanibacter sp.]|nr:hypothetical protein [Methyloceanibacter sp.]